MIQHLPPASLSEATDHAFEPVLILPANRTVALIPAHNEARFIGSLVLAARPFVDYVLVVDDGSTDATVRIARHAGALVISHRGNQGKAAAINTGFAALRQANARAVVMLDGDGQHSAEDIPTVIKPVLAGEADIVIGSRFLSVKNTIPAYRQLGQHSLTLMTNVASGVLTSDSQSGYRAFSPIALQALRFGSAGFSIESEMQFLARDHGLRVAEAPISVVYLEKAKRNPVSHGMQVLNGIMELVGQSRPLLFFGALGSGTVTLALLLGLLVINIYANTHQLAVGYGLITVLLMVIGIVLLFTGVILHSTRGMLLEFRRSVLERLPVVER